MIPVVKDMPVQQFPPKPVLNRNFKAPAGAFLPPDPEAIKNFETSMPRRRWMTALHQSLHR